jgi:crotonobetainyl-CoA:carnitine CoA-transferase CaiB-like acyl-CoA transferase
MGREDLRDDPRFATNAKRVENLAATDSIVQSWTETLTRGEVFAIARCYRVPCAPVRDLLEVTRDPHMHERGMLEWIEHPDLGRIVVPTTPLRFHGAERVSTSPSPRLGQHNKEIYGGWLGLSAKEIEALSRDGII